MFVEVYLFDAFDKTPYTEQGRDFEITPIQSQFRFYTYFYLTMTILDTRDVQVYSTGSSAVNSTVAFTWIIPDNLQGGEYKIVISGSYIADAIKVVRIREYQQEELVISAQLSQEAYLPSETVNGILRVRTATGTQLA
jgi:hypothetical protein